MNCLKIVIGFAVLILMQPPSSVHGQLSSTDQVDAILSAWRKRQTQFQNIRFEYTGEKVQPAGFPASIEGQREPGADTESVDSAEPVSGSFLLDLRHRRIRRHSVETRKVWDDTTKSETHLCRDATLVFDGMLFRNYAPKERNPVLNGKHLTELHIYAGRPNVIAVEYMHLPLLHSCGIVHIDKGYDPANLRPELKPSRFRMDGRAAVDGHECLVMRSIPVSGKRYLKFYVDKNDFRMIRRYQGFGGGWSGDDQGSGRPDVVLETTYQETEFGPLPKTWQVMRYHSPTKETVQEEMTLTRFEVDQELSDADFAFDPPPGTLVYDETQTGRLRKSVLGEKGSPNLPLNAYRLQENKRSPLRLFVSAAVVCVLIALALIMMRRRTASSGL